MTRDPELRYTPNGVAVCTFGVATNRTWTPPDGGEQREEVEFHNVVAWRKLADLCNQLLRKGRKVYISGRLQTRQWETPDGQRRERTEVVADQMILLDSRQGGGATTPYQPSRTPPQETPSVPSSPSPQASTPPSAPQAPPSSDTASSGTAAPPKATAEKPKEPPQDKPSARPSTGKDAGGKKEDEENIAADDIPF